MVPHESQNPGTLTRDRSMPVLAGLLSTFFRHLLLGVDFLIYIVLIACGPCKGHHSALASPTQRRMRNARSQVWQRDSSMVIAIGSSPMKCQSRIVLECIKSATTMISVTPQT